jgi:2-amino-4-hydroxy-6-hydroxymethyldihydropteridine diphosphokinase
MAEVIILLGSNIDPAENIRRGARHLAAQIPVLRASSVWSTPSFGVPGPGFYNAAVLCATELDENDLKYKFLRPIEENLGRVRSADKYAARTIDMDAIILNGEVIEPRLWDTAFILLPVAELVPHLQHPVTGKTLKELAKEIQPSSGANLLPDFPLFSK